MRPARKYWAALAAMALLLLVVPYTVRAAPQWVDLSTTITDTYISEEDDITNFDGEVNMSLAKTASPVGAMRILIRWDAAAVPVGATILDANLSLLVLENANASSYGQQTAARRVFTPWFPGGVIWLNQPTVEVDPFVFSDTQENGTRQMWNVTDALFATHGIRINYTFEAEPGDVNPGEHTVYATEENNTEADRPTLWVLYSSVPPEGDTFPAINITAFSASLRGNVTGMGSATELDVWFVFEAGDPSPDASESTHATASAEGVVQIQISGLSPDTLYYFQFHMEDVSDPASNAVGDVASFTTLENTFVDDLVRMVWLFFFFVLCVLFLMAAWWIKGRRGGMAE